MRLLLLFAVILAAPIVCRGDSAQRAALVEAVLSDDPDRQAEILRSLTDGTDPLLVRALEAWRGGVLYIHETDDAQIPFLLEQAADADGDARGIRIDTGEFLLDEDHAELRFAEFELVPADADSDLRRAIREALDLFALHHPDPRVRRDAVIKLGQQQNTAHLAPLEDRLARETDRRVRRSLEEAIALTLAAGEDPETRVEAIRRLGALRSVTSLATLRSMLERADQEPENTDPGTVKTLRRSIAAIENYISWGNFFGTGFRGLSLGAVLLVAALGLAITFGLMGVINMAHGEVMMVGAYTTYLTQNLFHAWFGPESPVFGVYFVFALAFSFVTAGLVGLVLERGIIRFLYRRPLESLLATWGVSLVLQQIFRHTFGAANVQVSSPEWLSGSLVIRDVLFAWNRLFVIGFAVLIVVATWLLLTRTSLGLQIRAVMQNRAMAAALGVRTSRVNMLTFAFGSGLAGMAGACLSQIGNVGPSLGQSYIVDCFMVVVLGGIGSLIGTVSAALGIGIADQVLQPWLGAVMGKITVLTAIILFLQWRPAGLFATRSRAL